MATILTQLAAKETLRVAGLMSGTSADGVDVAIVDMGPGGARVVAFGTAAYPAEVRSRLFRLFDPATARIDEVCRLNFVLGELFADALLRVARDHGIPLDSIDLVGSHGQTVCHLPPGHGPPARRTASTLQIGEPSVIAERTGITTVADFRVRDMAAGGEGAPLVPLADDLLFRDETKARAVQNIGGIANVTWLPPAGGVEDILAFDTGPGNMVIDRLVSLATGGAETFDRDGRMATRGQVIEPLLEQLMAHPFLARRPPKSTGRETFGHRFADELHERAGRSGWADADLVATATTLTARSIAEAYRRFLPAGPDEVILSGGGARNPALVGMLREQLAPTPLIVSDDLGIDADAREAVAFALLARETIRGAPGNVPSATGARRRVVLGKVIPAC